ncbi:MAG: DUF7681 family protein [Gammaproteobacteria bacterium]
MTETHEATKAIDPSLSEDHVAEIDAIDALMEDLKERVKALGPHRNHSVTITKIDEAQMWLRDRKFRHAGQ